MIKREELLSMAYAESTVKRNLTPDETVKQWVSHAHEPSIEGSFFSNGN